MTIYSRRQCLFLNRLTPEITERYHAVVLAIVLRDSCVFGMLHGLMRLERTVSRWNRATMLHWLFPIHSSGPPSCTLAVQLKNSL